MGPIYQFHATLVLFSLEDLRLFDEVVSRPSPLYMYILKNGLLLHLKIKTDFNCQIVYSGVILDDWSFKLFFM